MGTQGENERKTQGCRLCKEKNSCIQSKREGWLFLPPAERLACPGSAPHVLLGRGSHHLYLLHRDRSPYAHRARLCSHILRAILHAGGCLCQQQHSYCTPWRLISQNEAKLGFPQASTWSKFSNCFRNLVIKCKMILLCDMQFNNFSFFHAAWIHLVKILKHQQLLLSIKNAKCNITGAKAVL